MRRIIALDSGPLGLLTRRRGIKAADELRDWVDARDAAGTRFVVSAVVDYELRRELLRMRSADSVARLDDFLAAVPDRLLQVETLDLRYAAELWATLRRMGRPTADPRDLDVDVIQCAQLLLAFSSADFVVATSNATHLSLLVPADDWRNL